MRPLTLLALIPIIGINIGIYTESYFATLMCVILALTFTLPYVGSLLQSFAARNYQYRRVDFVTGFVTDRIR